MSEAMELFAALGPVLVLPRDETRKRQLQEKLKEYKARWNPYQAPELQMGTVCKIAVLEELLEYGFVSVFDFYDQMAETYGSGFDPDKFNTACGVIDNYCKTGGEGNVGGTRLPDV